MGVRATCRPVRLCWSVYADKADAHDFSINLDSWGVNTGETSNPMTALVATQNPNAGIGHRQFGPLFKSRSRCQTGFG
ncbi:hypothetical protein BQ8482_111180 [Mesorhizobium delmotii]|uniref:Uncharacterized protein n=1 Tax=Mesorhizobium delmotii TaxID=1631247 RepID=A0A2P9ADP8_9HYPH|nr:hypothetical protein BQ8482_111180 [Mesorhizobium delmotii]